MKFKILFIGLVASVGLCATEVTNRSYNRFAISLGEMSVTDHYLSNQEYSGITLGLDATIQHTTTLPIVVRLG
jgi:hypothetical protein